MGFILLIIFLIWFFITLSSKKDIKKKDIKSNNSHSLIYRSSLSSDIKTLNDVDIFSSNNNSSTRRKTSNSSYSKPAKKVHPYTQETGKKVPKVDLYNGIIASKKEDRTVGYKYGTYIKDGVLYSKKGEKIRNKEAYFRKAENRYISKHGKDEDYLERKKQHKKDVDDFLEWKRKYKNR